MTFIYDVVCGGAWSFVICEVVFLVNFGNERDGKVVLYRKYCVVVLSVKMVGRSVVTGL